MVPHIASRKTHRRFQEFFVRHPKRLLQQYRHFSDMPRLPSWVCFRG